MSRVACEGWWEQAGYGRQPMEQLQLAFDQGHISGSGTDIIGPFQFTGRLDGGNAVLLKQYLGRHRVDYLDTKYTLVGDHSTHYKFSACPSPNYLQRR